MSFKGGKIFVWKSAKKQSIDHNEFSRDPKPLSLLLEHFFVVKAFFQSRILKDIAQLLNLFSTEEVHFPNYFYLNQNKLKLLAVACELAN